MFTRLISRSFFATSGLSVMMLFLPQSSFSQPSSHELLVVPATKLPAEMKVAGESMSLHVANSDSLYLYVAEEHGRALAIFDVTDPAKIHFRGIYPVNGKGTFDFVQHAGPSLELIRYRTDGSFALLDLRYPKKPTLRSLGDANLNSYVIPSELQPDDSFYRKATVYRVFDSSGNSTPIEIKGVFQSLVDSGNWTTYLLREDGVTVIRNLKAEDKRREEAPIWTSTID